MNVAWLLRSRTLWGALALSSLVSTAVLWLSPGGLVQLHRQERELRDAQVELLKLNRENRDLFDEVKRLAGQDPELMEAMARRQGYAKSGETIYTFRDKGQNR